MSGRFLTVRFLTLPVGVTGPKTRWFVGIEYHGKGGGKAALTARCITNGKSVVLYDGGRATVTEQAGLRGFSVRIGTIQSKLVAAAVAQGVAEFVDTWAEFGGE